MRGRDDISGFVRAFAGSHRYILDYLEEEILRQQPTDVQAFLLQTAILDRLSGDLCNAVIEAGEPAEHRSFADSHAMLEYLERSNLFADLLRQRLQRKRSELVPGLHRRAGIWYEQRGLSSEAVGHLLAAKDFERAACMVEQAAWPMLTRGEMTTLLDWLAVLPDDVVRARPQLGVLHAWALALTGQVDRVEPCLLDVDLEPVQGKVAAIRAYVADLGRDLPRAIQFCHQALELLPEENLFLRSIVTLILGIDAYWTDGDPLTARQALAKAAVLGQASGNVHLDVTATCYLGHVQVMQGQLYRAVETFERAFQTAATGDTASTLFVGLGHVGMAQVLYEWNDLDGAMRHVRKGIELGERGEMDSLVEQLTEREMDVLRLIAAGLSNPEIADTLVIAVSTVKSHVNRIYGKLSVENRTRAVIKAQELALL